MERYILYHSGIKGMKWGVRRYQNKDGSLTPAGEKRYNRDTSNLSQKKKQNYKADPNKWVKEDLERTRRLTDETSAMTNKLKNLNDTQMRNQKKPKMDLSSMSDQEMRSQINRALLERQYNDMFAPQKSNRGREHVGQILETAGSVLAIGSSALGIALAIKELRG
jgi:hypothetical protein